MSSQDYTDELGAIDAIYPDTITKLNDGIIELIIPGNEWCKVRFLFDDEYPKIKPTILGVYSQRKFANDSAATELQPMLQDSLDEVFNVDQVCLFDFLNTLDELLQLELFEEQPDLEEYQTELIENADEIPSYWYQSAPVTDRGSTFVGFATEVHSDEEVDEKLYELRSNRKIAKSNHSMCAWRIKNSDGTVIQDSDDDGETAAGSRMLHLMTLMNVWNCLVVDVRWFGGTHIGPDRFKHINSTSREAILNSNFAEGLEKKKEI